MSEYVEEQITLDDASLFTLMKMAHEKDITLNALINEILREAINPYKNVNIINVTTGQIRQEPLNFQAKRSEYLRYIRLMNQGQILNLYAPTEEALRSMETK